jgi:hypothetical protein
MKKKIGEIYDKPIVIGDKNLVTENEIHVDQLGGVQGGGETGKLERNDVNFFDYDGTLLYAYTWEEAEKMSQLPQLPTHNGKTVEGWNYTLEDIKAQKLNAMAIKYEDRDNLYYLAYIKDIIIEGKKYMLWSDMSTLIDDDIYTDHTKSNWGHITEKMPNKGDNVACVSYEEDGWEIDLGDDNKPYCAQVKQLFERKGKVDVGAVVYDVDGNQIMEDGVLIIPKGYNNGALDGYTYEGMVFNVVSIPNDIIKIESHCFGNCTFTTTVKLPKSFVSYGQDCYSPFTECRLNSFYVNGFLYYWEIFGYSIIDSQIIEIPFGIQSCFFADEKSTYIKIPPTTNLVRLYDYSDNFAYRIFDFRQATSVVGVDRWQSDSHYAIVVPDALYDEWISSTAWANVAENIYAESVFSKSLLR